MAVRDLIYDAMYAAGILGEGDASPSPASAQFALRKLQRMLDSWANDGLMVFSTTEETMSLVANDATYTTANLSTTTRPVEVVSGFIRYGGVDYPVEMVTKQQWDAIGVKSSTGIPEVCYYDAAMTGNFTFHPVPQDTMTAYFNCRRVLGSGWTLDTVPSLPPGYEKAIVDNLAVELASGGFGVAATPAMMRAANASKAALQRTNYRPVFLNSALFASDVDDFRVN